MPTTLQNVIDRITLDYLNRTDMNAIAVRAVQSAIRHYETQRWPWNQTVTTLTCTNAISTLSVPSDFLVLDLLETVFQNLNYELIEKSFAEIRQINASPGSAGPPSYYAQRGTTFEFAPIPDSAYPVICHYINRLPALTSNAMTASNDWLSAAEDVIVYHATKLIWSNTLRNSEEAIKYAQLEQGAVTALVHFRDQNESGKLQATSF